MKGIKRGGSKMPKGVRRTVLLSTSFFLHHAGVYGQGYSTFNDDDYAMDQGLGYVYKKVWIAPSVSLRTYYDDHIRRAGVSSEDLVAAISPTIELVGPLPVSSEIKATFSYTPSYLAYLQNSSLNSLNHRALFTAQRSFAKTTVNLRQTFNQETDFYFETEEMLKQTTYATRLGLEYEISPKIEYNTAITRTSESLEGHRTVSNTTWGWRNDFNYVLSPKTRFGPFIGLDVWEIEQASARIHPMVGAQVSYVPAPKFGLSAMAGHEWIDATSGSPESAPLFAITANYLYSGKLSAFAIASRRHRLSLVNQGVSQALTEATIGVEHKFTEKIRTKLAFTYQHAVYSGFTSPAVPEGVIDIYYGQLNVDYFFNERLSTGFFVNHTDRETGSELGSYGRNRIGLQAVYKF